MAKLYHWCCCGNFLNKSLTDFRSCSKWKSGWSSEGPDDYKYMDVIDLVGCSQIVIGIVNLQPENLKRVSYFEIYFRFYLMRWLPVRTIEDLKDPQLFSPAIISSLKPQWPMVLWSRCLRIKLRRGTRWEVGEDKKWLRKQQTSYLSRPVRLAVVFFVNCVIFF